jgi:hypothetical protein
MANPNTPPFDDGKDIENGSPSAKMMRDLRKHPGTVAAMVEKLHTAGRRGQNDKILNTTRQGRTMESLKPECPPKKGIIVGK